MWHSHCSSPGLDKIGNGELDPDEVTSIIKDGKDGKLL